MIINFTVSQNLLIYKPYFSVNLNSCNHFVRNICFPTLKICLCIHSNRLLKMLIYLQCYITNKKCMYIWYSVVLIKWNLHIDCQFYLLLTLIIVKFGKFMIKQLKTQTAKTRKSFPYVCIREKVQQKRKICIRFDRPADGQNAWPENSCIFIHKFTIWDNIGIKTKAPRKRNYANLCRKKWRNIFSRFWFFKNSEWHF